MFTMFTWRGAAVLAVVVGCSQAERGAEDLASLPDLGEPPPDLSAPPPDLSAPPDAAVAESDDLAVGEDLTAPALMSGDGGSCKNGVADPGELCCDGASYAAFADGVVPWFAAHVPSSYCVPSLVILDVLGTTVTCCDQPCGGGSGCPVSVHHHGTAYASGTVT